MGNDDRMKIIKEYKTRYWLQAFGCEERLFGVKPLIQSRVRLVSFIDILVRIILFSMFKHVFVWINHYILN